MTAEPVKNKKRHFFLISVAIVIIVLVIGRLYLPTWLKNHTNQVLNDLPGFQGHVSEVSVQLFRGAYVFYDLQLYSSDAITEVPFLTIPKADVSVQWRALFSGEIVSEVYLDRPNLTFVFEDHDLDEQQDAEVSDWTSALDDLVPIDINLLEIKAGKLGLVKVSADPPIDLYIDQIELTADNLQLVEQEHKALPSVLKATGLTMGGGEVSVDSTADLVRNIPDLDFNASVEGIDVTALNDLTSHYANIDFESGNLNIHTELAIHDAFLKGYIKPVLTDAKLIDSGDGFFEKLWEGVVNVVKFIFKNHKQDNIATRIPLEGDLGDVESSAWKTFTNILKNAFISAFKDDIDEDINFSDAQKREDNQ